MSLILELPVEIESRLRKDMPNFENDAKEAIALDLFRKEIITQHELGQMLGLNRMEAERFLKERNEFSQCLTMEEIDCDRETLKNWLRNSGR